MLRPAADVGERKAGKQIGDRPLAVNDAKALLDHSFQVDPPPAYDAVRLRIGAGLHDLGQFLHLSVGELPWPAGTADVVCTEKDAAKLVGVPTGATRVWVVGLDFSLPESFVAAVRERVAARRRP